MLSNPKPSSPADRQPAPAEPASSRRFRARALTISAVMAFGVLAAAGAANAAEFTVNSPTDAALTNPSSLTCHSTESGTCTLRAAVQAADNVGGASTITLPAGGYTLTLPSTAADEPANGDLDVKGSATKLTINGAGAGNSVINAAHIDRAFAVQVGESLTISGVSVRNGAQNGAAPSDNSSSDDDGGAFYNDGSLTIENSVLTHNSSYEEGGAIYAGASATSTSLIDSTVSENTADGQGGAVFASSGSITISNSSLAHNTADGDGGVVAAEESGHTEGAVEVSGSALSYNSSEDYGGAIYLTHTGAVTVSEGTEIDDNTAEAYGGGIYAGNTGLITLEGAEFYGNTSGKDEGGAVYAYESDISINESSFNNNVASEGGALYIEGTAAAAEETITDSTFDENSATDSTGGAIYMDEGDLILSGSTFYTNNASGEGGALYGDSDDGMSLTNDTFSGNEAGSAGGAIYFDTTATTGTMTLLNDTIAHNSAYKGGGIYDPENANVIENTIVAENAGGSTSDGGGDCYGTATKENAGQADSGGNIDSDGTCFGKGTGDKINTDPLLVGLNGNGGFTETNALEPDSPAIGAGVGSPESCPATDQRGVTRTGGCDVGAYQVEPADVSIAASASPSGTVGSPITYTLTAKDAGPAPATNVTVTDTLPAGTTYFSSGSVEGLGEICSAEEGTVTCSLGTLDNGRSATVRIVVIPDEAGTVENTATVTARETDPETENNSSTAETDVLSNERVEQVETTKTVEVTKTVNSVETKTVYVNVPTNVSGSTTTETQCKSARSETISWKVPGGVSLRRIVVTRNGKTYKTLAGSARKVTVSMVGLPKGAVPVKITGYTASGQRYVMTRTFHLCVPAKEGGISTDYLTKE